MHEEISCFIECRTSIKSTCIKQADLGFQASDLYCTQCTQCKRIKVGEKQRTRDYKTFFIQSAVAQLVEH